MRKYKFSVIWFFKYSFFKKKKQFFSRGFELPISPPTMASEFFVRGPFYKTRFFLLEFSIKTHVLVFFLKKIRKLGENGKAPLE